MSEKLLLDQGPIIQLPSALRIRQRLGHVSTSKAFKKDLVTPITTLGGAEHSAPLLATTLALTTTIYADKHGHDLNRYPRHILPKVIRQLVPRGNERHELLHHTELALDHMLSAKESKPVDGGNTVDQDFATMLQDAINSTELR